MKPVVQQDRTGCGIASVAVLSHQNYATVKKAATQLGIAVTDPTLCAHAAQTEFHIILADTGPVTDETGKVTPIKTGDHFIFLPGEAHQITNDSQADLEYLVPADYHRANVTIYPITGKRMLKPETRCIRAVDVDYYEGEE